MPDDLFTALGMLQNSANQVATTQAINDANNQMQQANLQIQDEGQRQQAIRNIASNLTMQMIKSGAPADKIGMANQAVMQPPPNVQNPMEAFLNPRTHDLAQQYMAINQANQVQLAQIRANNQFKMMKFLQDQGNHGDTEFDKFAHMDPAQAVRNSLGQAFQNSNLAERVSQLVGNGQTLDQLDQKDKINVQEAVMGLTKMLSNGTVSEEEMRQLFPQTAGMAKGDMIRFITSHPTGANAGAFLQLYNQMAQRQKGVNQGILYDGVLRNAQAEAHLANQVDQQGNSREPQFKEIVANQLRDVAGANVTSDMISVDPDTKKVSVNLGPQQGQLDKAMSVVKQAKANLRAGSPAAQKEALGVFHQLGFNGDEPVSKIQRALELRLLQNRVK